MNRYLCGKNFTFSEVTVGESALTRNQLIETGMSKIVKFVFALFSQPQNRIPIPTKIHNT